MSEVGVFDDLAYTDIKTLNFEVRADSGDFNDLNNPPDIPDTPLPPLPQFEVIT